MNSVINTFIFHFKYSYSFLMCRNKVPYYSPLSFPNLSTWSERMRLNTNSFITGTMFLIKISDKFIRLYLSKKKISLCYLRINSNSPKILLWGVWNVNECLHFMLPSRRIRVCKSYETKHLANLSGNTSDNLEISENRMI